MSADLPGLDQLRELPMPPPVPYWPQTWGWALLALIVLALSVYALVAGLRRHRRNRYRRQALIELARIRAQAGRQTLAARALPDLLKRTALAARSSAGLRPDASLAVVALPLPSPLPADSGPLLATLAYAPDATVRELDPATLDLLFDASRRWIERHHVAA
ncbi:DUF4381 family protein [Bordetella sp. N]|uniref:DUF4381 family protein n=1 Tax=Bordetella sp. N TaxID=1746199 RepID=UPI00070D11AB|nr:DUF4381 family protein [Bordetella sp. N]ALM82977.1 alpha-2 type XI collagen [Bordetella sp. N]